MGKFFASLLSMVLQLYALSPVLGDELVSEVQEALRRRHLYYGDPTGEMSPALSAAITRYQEKKGFHPTGSIDAEICASLGIIRPVPVAARTPFVVENNGMVRGANGELLPETLPWPADKHPVRFGLSAINHDNFGRKLTPSTEVKAAPARRPTTGPPRTPSRARARKETNPFVLALRSVDNAVKFLFGEKDQKKKRTARKRS